MSLAKYTKNRRAKQGRKQSKGEAAEARTRDAIAKRRGGGSGRMIDTRKEVVRKAPKAKQIGNAMGQLGRIKSKASKKTTSKIWSPKKRKAKVAGAVNRVGKAYKKAGKK